MIDYSQWFHGFPPEIATTLLATMPIAELRVALPVALLVYDLPLITAFFWAVLGNMLPVFFILWLIRPAATFLVKHSKLADKFFAWWFNRIRYKFEKKSVKYGVHLAVILFVAVPLPFTGAWSGSVASFLFGIPPRRALILILTGVIIAGIIVSALVSGGTYIFG